MDDMRVCESCTEMFSEDDAGYVTEGGSGAWECPSCGSHDTVSFEEFQDSMDDAEQAYENQGGHD